MIVHIVAKDMDIPVHIPGGKLYAGDDFEAGAFGSADGFVNAVSGVVVCQGESGQAIRAGQGDQFRGRKGAVGMAGMDMQINGFHDSDTS